MRRPFKLALLIPLLTFATTLAAAADAKPDVAPSPAAWSPYQPPVQPGLPPVKQPDWVRQPLDAFVLAKLEAKNVKPSPEADRATYIRRATLDAWGLLPTPEETRAFVDDRSPNAYEKLVDRLLASPHFGERQARRWLDLARYADSSGFQNDNTRPNNWRYRDYVIAAFNADKPFDKFIREQIAGDEIWPNRQEAKIATGFLAGYPDNANSRDLVQRKYQIETDMTDLVGNTFLAATVGCARCHNHKQDKVSQKEYFQLQAFFANTSFDEKSPLLQKTSWDLDFEKKQAAYREATKTIREQQKAILDSVRDKATQYHKERYLTDSRESIFKPEKDWSPLDRWVNFRLKAVSTEQDIAQYLKLTTDKGSEVYDPANVEKWAEYEKLAAELKNFDKLKPTRGSAHLTAATELERAEAPPTFVRFGGVHERPTEEVQPALPQLWAGSETALKIEPTAKSSGRRTALANWIASDANPLTARVFVNRVWAQYFDKGIVGTVSNFGRAGSKPTHPELLDYLAVEFVQNAWSVKKLEREILLSSTYRQSSAQRDDLQKFDPDNTLLAVFPRKRLEAEEIRDTLLYASGTLIDQIGGPPVYPALPGNLAAGTLWDASKDPSDQRRRSVYTFVRRSLPYPLTQNFDPADPSVPHPKRDVTTTPLQALTLFNSDVVLQWSQALAGRVINDAGDNENARLDRLYEILFAREPSRAERGALRDFLDREVEVVRSKSADSGTFQVAVPIGLKGAQGDPIRAAAFVDLVHTVANSNEFAYRF